MAFLASKSNPACIRSPHPIYIEVLQTITIFKPCHAQNLMAKNLFKAGNAKDWKWNANLKFVAAHADLAKLTTAWFQCVNWCLLSIQIIFCQKKVKFSATPNKNHRVKQTKFTSKPSKFWEISKQPSSKNNLKSRFRTIIHPVSSIV